MNTDLCLDLVDFAHAFGTTPGQISANLREQIERSDFRYRKLTQCERDQIIFRVLKRIHSGELSKVGEHRKEIWEKGWEENLNEFASKGGYMREQYHGPWMGNLRMRLPWSTEALSGAIKLG